MNGKNMFVRLSAVSFIFFIFFISIFFSLHSYAEERIKLSGYFQNFFIFKTDGDFDPSSAFYEPWGQTVSFIGTYAEPKFIFELGENSLAFAIETLIGFNVWSKNSPFARPDEQAGRQLFLFMRQLYSETANLKIGYQYFADPLEIFVRHWIGGLRLDTRKISVFVGQIPDQTFEGIQVFSNNLINDTFLFAFAFAEGGFTKADFIPFFGNGFFSGVYNVLDNSIIRKPRFVSSFISGYNYDTSDFHFIGGIALQAGIFKNSSFAGDELHLAGALQIRAGTKGKIPLGGELMLLSPDGPNYIDGINSGFIYSGKSMSRTLLLTEDEIIFKSDNLDLNIGENFSVFKLMRPGLLIFDIWTDFTPIQNISFNPILGVGFTLDRLTFDDQKSLSSMFLGLELSPVIRYRRGGILIEVANTFFIPGDGAAAYINLINPEKLRPFIYSFETSLKLIF